jgi:hypothetical protein
MDPSSFSQFLRRLECRALVLIVTICTKHMKSFSALHSWSRRVGINARTDFGKFVLLLFSVPCFQASNFFFKLAYRLNQRRAFLVNRKNSVLGISVCEGAGLSQRPFVQGDLRQL